MKKRERIRAKVQIGVKPDNTPLYKWVSAYTKKDLAKAVAEMEERFISGTDAKRITVAKYADVWFAAHAAGLKPSSVMLYRSVTNAHVIPALGSCYLASVTRPMLIDLLSDLQQRGYGQTILGRVAFILRDLFAMAKADGLIKVDPAYKLKAPASTVEPVKRRALTEAERAATLQIIDERMDGWMYLAVLYYTGARRGEALGLRWEDIDFTAMTISISGQAICADGFKRGSTKTHSGNRVIPMPKELADLLRPHRGIGSIYSAPLLQTQLHYFELITYRMAEIAPEIELEDGHSVLTPHYYRHNWGSVLIRAGVEAKQVSEWMGHSSIAVTLDVYTHLFAETVAANAKKIEGAF